MKISACYIVGKNEQYFENSLKSIENLADELIIIDTTAGADPTIKVLAEKYHGHLYSFRWQDDFSAARNFALKKAKGDWIIFLDADEYFNLCIRENIKKYLEKADAEQINVLLVKMYNLEDNDAIIDYFWAPRFFKRKKEIHYTGKIHEQITCSSGELKNGIISEAAAILFHKGYSKNQLQKKAQRNLKILLQELEYTEQPESLYMAIAEAYEGIGKLEMAEKYARMDILNGRQNITYASRSYRVLLRVLEQRGASSSAICHVLHKAVQDFSEIPEFHAEYAQYLAADYRFLEAVQEMEAALKLGEEQHSIEPIFFEIEQKQLAQSLLEKWKSMNLRIESLKISACVIMKNEENEISRWIDNMEKFADEIIIVDTGSTDNSVKIAEKKGNYVYRYQWEDNFAAAKNFAIGKATGDWIAFLDADEYFSEDTVDHVRKAIVMAEFEKENYDAIMCLEIDIDTDQNCMEQDRFLSLRLFKNDSDLCYQGKVHEAIYKKSGKLSLYVESKHLRIYHTGYSQKRIKDKLKRNLELLQQDISLRGEKPEHYRYLMDCYHVLGNYEEAVRYGKLHLASNVSSVGMESQVYATLINSMIFLKTEEAEIRSFIKEAMDKFPEIPDFIAFYAGSFMREKKFAEAKKYLLQSLTVYEQNFSSIMESSNYMYILTAVCSNLAEIFYQEGLLDQARIYTEKALQENKYNKDAFSLLWKLISHLSKMQKIEIIDRWYIEREADLLFLEKQLEENELEEIYFFYADKLEKVYRKKSVKYRFYQQIKQNNNKAAFCMALSESKKNLAHLLYGVFLYRKYSIFEWSDFLQSEFEHIALQYHGEKDNNLKEYFTVYRDVLEMFCHIHPQDSIFWKQFLGMSKYFSYKQQTEIVDILYKNSCFFALRLLFPENEVEQTFLTKDVSAALIWIRAFFVCKEYSWARKYLEAIEFDDREELELTSYKIWLQEMKMEGSGKL